MCSPAYRCYIIPAVGRLCHIKLDVRCVNLPAGRAGCRRRLPHAAAITAATTHTRCRGGEIFRHHSSKPIYQLWEVGRNDQVMFEIKKTMTPLTRKKIARYQGTERQWGSKETNQAQVKTKSKPSKNRCENMDMIRYCTK